MFHHGWFRSTWKEVENKLFSWQTFVYMFKKQQILKIHVEKHCS